MLRILQNMRFSRPSAAKRPFHVQSMVNSPYDLYQKIGKLREQMEDNNQKQRDIIDKLQKLELIIKDLQEQIIKIEQDRFYLKNDEFKLLEK